jgi:transposase
MERMRRAEVAERRELKGTRYHWLKDASDWTRAELDLHWLRMTRCQTTRAWQMKEALRDLLQLRHQPNAPVILLLDRWISWARRSRLPPFKRLARTFAHHHAGIDRMRAAANSNARAESINAAIQAQISRARGFRTLAKNPRHRPLDLRWPQAAQHPLSGQPIHRPHRNVIHKRRHEPFGRSVVVSIEP